MRPLSRRQRLLLARQIRDQLKRVATMSPAARANLAGLMRYSISPYVASGQTIYSAANKQLVSRTANAVEASAAADVAAALVLYRTLSTQ